MDENIVNAIKRLTHDKLLDGAIKLYEEAIEEARYFDYPQKVTIDLNLAEDALIFMKQLKTVRKFLCDEYERKQRIEQKIDKILEKIKRDNG